MAVQKEEFKFPDEVEGKEESAQVDDSNDLSVEIEDDTPPEDRGRVPLPKEVVKELEDDTLEEYSDKVKKRLSQMKKVWHDERREKERAAREKEEALRFAQQAFEENKALKARLGQGEKILVSEVTKAATNELATAKEKLKAAYESGDSSLIADAQEAMTDAKLKLQRYQQFRPSVQEQENSVQTTSEVNQPQRPAPSVDPKAEAWRQRNTWFGADEEMTALALGLHEKLVRSGVDPRSDEYYNRVDSTMRKRFPEAFEDEPTQTQEKAQETKPSSRAKATTVVAPATRTTAPRQVKLTPSQVAIAKRLGLSNEAYAKEMIKLENGNG
jgi:hypothetical protein